MEEITKYDAARMRLVEGAQQLRDEISAQRRAIMVERDQAKNTRDYDEADAHAAALEECYSTLVELLRGHPINAAHFQTRAMHRHIAEARYVIAGMERIIAMIEAAQGEAHDEIEAQWQEAIMRMRHSS